MQPIRLIPPTLSSPLFHSGTPRLRADAGALRSGIYMYEFECGFNALNGVNEFNDGRQWFL